jgi:hypothetical protein
MALNFGTLYKRLNYISNLGPNIRFIVGGEPISGWSGGREQAHSVLDSLDCPVAAKRHSLRSLGLGYWREGKPGE